MIPPTAPNSAVAQTTDDGTSDSDATAAQSDDVSDAEGTESATTSTLLQKLSRTRPGNPSPRNWSST